MPQQPGAILRWLEGMGLGCPAAEKGCSICCCLLQWLGYFNVSDNPPFFFFFACEDGI